MAFVQRLAFHIGQRDASRLSVAGMDLVFHSTRHQIHLLAVWTMGVHQQAAYFGGCQFINHHVVAERVETEHIVHGDIAFRQFLDAYSSPILKSDVQRKDASEGIGHQVSKRCSSLKRCGGFCQDLRQRRFLIIGLDLLLNVSAFFLKRADVYQLESFLLDLFA